MTDLDLVKKAEEASKMAYAPYSGFGVGAALLCSDGTVFTGCNVEGASFGNAICAERVALVKAISHGNKSFEAIAVWAKSHDYVSPCGICRQMLYEFSKDMRVICSNQHGEFVVKNIGELLPLGFSGESMGEE